MEKVILFDSIKGGVGKSTLAAQFAVYLSNIGSVAIMDCDPQQTLNKWLMRRNEADGKFSTNFPAMSPDFNFSEKKSKSFDFIIVDSAGIDSQTGRKMLLEADYVIAPLKPSQADLDTVLDHSDVIKEALSLNKKMKSFYLFNMCSTHPKDKERSDSLALLQALSKDKEITPKVLSDSVFDRKILRTSFSEGGSCFEDKRNKSAEEIETIIKTILEV